MALLVRVLWALALSVWYQRRCPARNSCVSLIRPHTWGVTGTGQFVREKFQLDWRIGGGLFLRNHATPCTVRIRVAVERGNGHVCRVGLHRLRHACRTAGVDDRRDTRLQVLRKHSLVVLQQIVIRRAIEKLAVFELVPGITHGLAAEGITAGLRRLWPRRRADRRGASTAV